MHRMTKATFISKKTKEIVYRRDRGLCVFCGIPGDPVAHVVRRSQGGIGKPENVVTACFRCHREFDEGKDRETMYVHAVEYLKHFYPGWKREDMIYRKGD